jgi:hypothetical protein
MRRYGLEIFETGKGPMVSSCEHDSETAGYIHGVEFID